MEDPIEKFDVAVIGGGAAGFFGAINCFKHVVLLEKTNQLLAKVRISGGGRCNVTHACFDPAKLVHYYPRGHRALLGPFHRFQPRDTIEWFESRGVNLKTEGDGRIFPVSDSSQSIIDCLQSQAKERGVEIRLRQTIEKIEKTEDGFSILIKDGTTLQVKSLLLATGSSPQGFEWAKQFGHTVVDPVPSLFTFNVPSSPLKDLSGISVPEARLKIDSFVQEGPLLITHFGFSGPAALKLSAFSARWLHEKKYQADLVITWAKQATNELLKLKKEHPQETLWHANPFHFPKQLWKTFLELHKMEAQRPLLHLSNDSLIHFGEALQESHYKIEGKTTNKEEFVTAGGIDLDEVNFKTMESRLCKGLYFAGEILNIDGVTGGFNFQNAWTGGFLASQAM